MLKKILPLLLTASFVCLLTHATTTDAYAKSNNMDDGGASPSAASSSPSSPPSSGTPSSSSQGNNTAPSLASAYPFSPDDPKASDWDNLVSQLSDQQKTIGLKNLFRLYPPSTKEDVKKGYYTLLKDGIKRQTERTDNKPDDVKQTIAFDKLGMLVLYNLAPQALIDQINAIAAARKAAIAKVIDVITTLPQDKTDPKKLDLKPLLAYTDWKTLMEASGLTKEELKQNIDILNKRYTEKEEDRATILKSMDGLQSDVGQIKARPKGGQSQMRAGNVANSLLRYHVANKESATILAGMGG